jgi:RimJ/RimL family protein N-acetyltransferase
MNGAELRPWTKADKPALIRLCNQVDRRFLSGSLPYPYRIPDADLRLRTVEMRDGKTAVYRAVWTEERLVGCVIIEEREGIFSVDAEIAYLMLPEFTGRGLMTAAVRETCALAFQMLPLARITGRCAAENAASCRVLEKAGFQPEGRLRNAMHKNGMMQDIMLYGLLRPETLPPVPVRS